MIKVLLYIVVTPIIMWALESINTNQLFKKNRMYQASILFIVISIALSYLVVNFFFDFFISSNAAVWS